MAPLRHLQLYFVQSLTVNDFLERFPWYESYYDLAGANSVSCLRIHVCQMSNQEQSANCIVGFLRKEFFLFCTERSCQRAVVAVFDLRFGCCLAVIVTRVGHQQQVGAATHARWGGEPHIQLALANCSRLVARPTSAMTSLPPWRELPQEFALLPPQLSYWTLI